MYMFFCSALTENLFPVAKKIMVSALLYMTVSAKYGNYRGTNAAKGCRKCLKSNNVTSNIKFKHEERYSAPLCKLYAFEAKRVLCVSGPGGAGDNGDDNIDNGEW